MSAETLVRRTWADVSFQGVDITESLRPYFLGLTYTDNEDGEADDLQIRLQDRARIWQEKWLEDMVNAAASGKFKIKADILQENWQGGGRDTRLPCGEFELDSVEASGPPSVVTVKSTSLPFSSSIRQTRKTKAWEKYTLSGIAREIAAQNGLQCMYESAVNPGYDRVEQTRQSDVKFLERLCKDAGLSLKATDKTLVLFDQSKFEKRAPVRTIRRGEGYLSCTLRTSTAGTQYASCRVSYADPLTGKKIEGVARVDDYDEKAKNNQQLEVRAKVKSVGEAKALAEKRLRLHNRFSKTAKFVFPGDPALLAGNTVLLEDWGAFDGKYLISQAVHKVDGGGYTTAIQVRRVIGGY